MYKSRSRDRLDHAPSLISLMVSVDVKHHVYLRLDHRMPGFTWLDDAGSAAAVTEPPQLFGRAGRVGLRQNDSVTSLFRQCPLNGHIGHRLMQSCHVGPLSQPPKIMILNSCHSEPRRCQSVPNGVSPDWLWDGRPGWAPSLISLRVSVDVKQHSTNQIVSTGPGFCLSLVSHVIA